MEGDGEAIVVAVIETEERRLLFTERFRCPDHPEVMFTDPSPQLFSFNNPFGTCQVCTGFGATLDYDVDLVVPSGEVSISDGAVDPWAKPRYRREREKLKTFAIDEGVSIYSPWDELPEAVSYTHLTLPTICSV